MSATTGQMPVDASSAVAQVSRMHITARPVQFKKGTEMDAPKLSISVRLERIYSTKERSLASKNGERSIL